MSNLDELRQKEAEREFRERQARTRWEAAEQARYKRAVLEEDFPDEWLAEIESEATE